MDSWTTKTFDSIYFIFQAKDYVPGLSIKDDLDLEEDEPMTDSKVKVKKEEYGNGTIEEDEDHEADEDYKPTDYELEQSLDDDGDELFYDDDMKYESDEDRPLSSKIRKRIKDNPENR